MQTPKERYQNARSFRAAIAAKLKTESRKTGIPYVELYRRITIDRFLASLDWSRWIAKGGYVLQRRFPQARATKVLMVPIKEEVFAEKIHAYTMPRDKENTRVKDMLDLALLLESGLDPQRTKEAIAGVFAIRKTHSPPKVLPLPPKSWQTTFTALAKDASLQMTLDDVFAKIAQYYLESIKE